MMWDCEMIHHIVTNSECSDFSISRFGLSADQYLVHVLIGYAPI